MSAIAGGPNFLVEDPSFAIDFAPNGTLLGLNETITRKRYADTLETIAERGPYAFYIGPIANATINALQASGGTMTLENLESYKIALTCWTQLVELSRDPGSPKSQYMISRAERYNLDPQQQGKGLISAILTYEIPYSHGVL